MILISMAELRQFDDDVRDRKYIACSGFVYDVTDCPKWLALLHEGQHFPGQDLTSEIADAPHKDEVFDYPCVRLVGKLEDNTDE